MTQSPSGHTFQSHTCLLIASLVTQIPQHSIDVSDFPHPHCPTKPHRYINSNNNINRHRSLPTRPAIPKLFLYDRSRKASDGGRWLARWSIHFPPGQNPVGEPVFQRQGKANYPGSWFCASQSCIGASNQKIKQTTCALLSDRFFVVVFRALFAVNSNQYQFKFCIERYLPVCPGLFDRSLWLLRYDSILQFSVLPGNGSAGWALPSIPAELQKGRCKRFLHTARNHKKVFNWVKGSVCCCVIVNKVKQMGKPHPLDCLRWTLLFEHSLKNTLSSGRLPSARGIARDAPWKSKWVRKTASPWRAQAHKQSGNARMVKHGRACHRAEENAKSSFQLLRSTSAVRSRFDRCSVRSGFLPFA